jgi:hypothetical protein
MVGIGIKQHALVGYLSEYFFKINHGKDIVFGLHVP